MSIPRLLFILGMNFFNTLLASAQCAQSIITIEITTDQWGDETSWEVFDQATSQIVGQGGNYTGNSTYVETVCVDSAGCYTVIVKDSMGDGMCCNYGSGSYLIQLNGSVIDSGGTFSFEERVSDIGMNCPSSPPLVVDYSTYTPQQLISDVLLGSGIAVSNISYTGMPQQIGYFENGGALGIERGVLLTTGSVTNAIGPNTVSDATFIVGVQGDSLLEASLGSSRWSSSDAAIIEFDMIPSTNEVTLRYIFASEEYPEYVCSQFNDAFAFFVTGQGYLPNTNVALIPGTSAKVAINSVNGGIAGPYGTSAACVSLGNSNLYVNNYYYNITQYDGYTVPLIASIGVVPNTTYHVKLVIADFLDDILDSGIFLEANSFTTGITNIAASICPGDSMFVGGAWQQLAGTYTDTFTALNGSDSIVVTNLTVIDPQVQVALSICSGDSFFINNQWQHIPGTYSDTLVSSLGCDSIVTVTLSVEPFITGVFNLSICAGDSIFAGGNWQQSAGIFSDTFIASGGCDSIVSTVLTVDSNLVWPGDANGDGVANNTDLLSIGLHFGENGHPRDSLSYIWQGECSQNWGTSQLNGADIKHTDCNGDGLIGRTDTLALNINYALTHAKAEGVSASGVAPVLTLVPRNSIYSSGDTVLLDVVIGTDALPVDELYGIAFTVSFDNSKIESGTIRLHYSDSWLENIANALTLSKPFESNGKLDGALTKTNHQNASGYGVISTLQFVADSEINSFESIAVAFTNYEAVKANGEAVVFDVQDATFTIDGTNSVHFSESLHSFKIYPNPFSSSATIEFSLIKENEVALRVYDVVGKLLYENVALHKAGINQIQFLQTTSGQGLLIAELGINGAKQRKMLFQAK